MFLLTYIKEEFYKGNEKIFKGVKVFRREEFSKLQIKRMKYLGYLYKIVNFLGEY